MYSEKALIAVICTDGVEFLIYQYLFRDSSISGGGATACPFALNASSRDRTADMFSRRVMLSNALYAYFARALMRRFVSWMLYVAVLPIQDIPVEGRPEPNASRAAEHVLKFLSRQFKRHLPIASRVTGGDCVSYKVKKPPF